MTTLATNSASKHHDDNVATVADEAVNPNDTMVLLDKFVVDTEFFDLVESEFQDIYPFLLEEVDYTPAELIGEPLWADLNALAQRQAIHCLQHLATLDDVPLFGVSCPCCGTTTFQIV